MDCPCRSAKHQIRLEQLAYFVFRGLSQPLASISPIHAPKG